MALREGDLEKLYKEGKDQVFFLQSPLPLPHSWALHSWLVTCDSEGGVDRWEVWHMEDDECDEHWGHVYRNLRWFEPWIGFNRIPNIKYPRWRGSIIGAVEGDKASEIISFLKNDLNEYPYKDDYGTFGPNSNTFPRWLIDEFGLDIELSWRAVGKDYSR